MAVTESRGTLGTFSGVFTPSILTILGIILFLRLGLVVGEAGLRNALVMILFATAVSVLTSISLAAISTNFRVGGGGDYYLISRTLGTEFGGAIGIVLYLAQAVSIAFYAIGFGEAISSIIGWSASWGPQVIAAAAVLFLFGFAWAGADVASRLQFVVMALLIAALASFYAGAFGSYEGAAVRESLSPLPEGLGFWTLFAILFPAVTGFTQGVSMSGDLRDPGKSLPRGTFAAVGLSTVVYISVAVLMAGSATQEALATDTGTMGDIAAVGWLIDVGVVAATLSSAMASFLGAPRILQSLASDRIFPILRFFAVGDGESGNPRRGVLLSLVIALGTIALGSLNVIAPVVSMFFLISYGLLNYATYYEAHASSPAFRPRFRFFHRRASLAGAVACLGAMLAINPLVGAGAALVMYLIYKYLEGRDRVERWADASHSHFFQRAKDSIRALAGESDHARNWRPRMLAFSADPARRARLLRFTTWLEGGSGLTAVAQIVAGEGALKRLERSEAHEVLEEQIDELDLDVHALTVLAPDPLDALPVIAQSFGIGPMSANTAVFGLPEDPDQAAWESYVMALRSVARLGLGVVAVSSNEEVWQFTQEVPRKHRVIDVWWADDDTGREALLMAYLATRTEDWGRAKIRLLAPADDTPDQAGALEAMLEDARISAEVVVVPEPSAAVIRSVSAGATLVMLPMRLKGTTLLDEIAGVELPGLMSKLPLTAAVMAASPIDLTADPESGPAAELLAAEERADVANDRLRTLERQLKHAEADLRQLKVALPNWPSLASEVEVAEARVADLTRRVGKARARVDVAQADLDELRNGRR